MSYNPLSDTSLPTYDPAKDPEKVDPIQSTAAQNSVLNKLTGTLGKTVDTFLDALAIGAANKVVGTSYPTGQMSPAQLAAYNQANNLQTQNTQAFNWKPWAIGGSIAVGSIILLAVVLPRSK
jgi:hypothetical protein